MYKNKLREFSIANEKLCNPDINDKKAMQASIKNTADTLRKHLKVASADNISGQWLNIYCKYFHCSCDYLMGYISRPNQINTDISKQIGLSDAAIDTLRTLNGSMNTPNNPDAIKKYYADMLSDEDSTSIQSSLNRILTNTKNCEILNLINLYLEYQDIGNNIVSYNDMVYDANMLYRSALKDNIFMQLEKLKGTT